MWKIHHVEAASEITIKTNERQLANMILSHAVKP